ncbi:MAG: glycoside hydrolase family 97 protein [Clostridiales bacterium]|nr:glycoside hydrolase family 97 protein [Clostridiales bacterium]
MWRETGRWLYDKNAKIKGLRANVKRCSPKSACLPDPDFKTVLSEAYTMNSPEGNISATLIPGSSLSWSVSFNGIPVIEPSALGIVTGGMKLSEDAVLAPPRSEEYHGTFPERDKKSEASDIHRKFIFPVKHIPTGLKYTLEFRIWNDGVGFRFVFSDDTKMLVDSEATTFRVNRDSVCIYQPDAKKLQGKSLKTRTPDIPDGTLMAFMTAFILPDNAGYCLLTESNLNNYPGAALRYKPDGEFSIDFWDSGKFFAKGCKSPWRLVILSPTLNGFVNSDVVKCSADPPDEKLFADTSWIRPGKAVWSYFIDREASIDYNTEISFNAYAQRLGFPYSVVDHGWRRWAKTEPGAFKRLRGVVEDAEKHGIGVWAWKASTMGPLWPRYRRWFLDKCVECGVKGVKMDLIESETQVAINFYRGFLEEAAKRHIMVIYHNPNKPTGLSRTYPNLLTREAIRGIQSNCDPDDNVLLPFTRFSAGGADYTPYCFSVEKRNGGATLAHKLANTVVYNSALLTISEHPENIVGHISESFIRALPSVWDETLVLEPSEIGRLAVFARRTGEAWFAAGQQGSGEGENIPLSLGFLNRHTCYSCELFTDVPGNPECMNREELEVSYETVLNIKTCSGGGFAMRLVPKGQLDNNSMEVKI